MVDTEISLIGRFSVRAGSAEIEVPRTMRQLLAHLALSGHAVPRSRLAAVVWPDAPDGRARANLRAAFWRVEELRQLVVRCDDDLVRLNVRASVDLPDMRRRGVTALRSDRVPDDLGRDPRLLADLCPSIVEDWIAPDRERWRQLRLHVIVRYLRELHATDRRDEAADLADLAASSAPSLESIAALRTPRHPGRRSTPATGGAACRRPSRSAPIHPRSQPKEASR